MVGLWHLGTVTAAGFAELGYSVTGLDDDAVRVSNLNTGRAPLFEPGLDDLLKQGLSRGNLRFTSDYAEALRKATVVWLAYDTPVDNNDEVDLTCIRSAVAKIGLHIRDGAIVVVHSQVPVGTCDEIVSALGDAAAGRRIGVACVPENLRLGKALERFRKPAMLVVGADQEEVGAAVEQFLAPLPCAKVRMNLRSAEMTKHAINAYLATCVSYINELANLCDEVGADASMVSEALRMDERVSPRAPLLPGGLGFAGATLARDLRALQRLGRRVGHPTYLSNAVLDVNEEQKRIVHRRLKWVFGSLDGITVGILGLTYKTGTSTLRRSAAIEIARSLKCEGAIVKGYDPKAAVEELHGDDVIQFCRSAEDAAAGSNALVIVTEWPEFRDLDFGALAERMKDKVLIDTKNLLDARRIRDLGFQYSDVGRGTMFEKLPLGDRGVACG